jgi:peptidoglycan/LPS O-acetylase OafA/YrhL
VSEWWNYRPENFLLFSERAYWRMFELANESYWPLPVITFALGVYCLVVLTKVAFRKASMFDSARDRSASRFIRFALLAFSIGSAWVAWSFLYERYASINWAMHYFAIAFTVQAVLLFAFALMPSPQVNRAPVRRGAAITLLLFATVIYPFLAVISGRGWTRAEVIFIAPDPTAIAMLGLLLLIRGAHRGAGLLKRLLCVVPIAWLVSSVATLATLGLVHATFPALALAMVVAASLIDPIKRMR